MTFSLHSGFILEEDCVDAFSVLRSTFSKSPMGDLWFILHAIIRKGQHSVRSYYGSKQQENQMVELEAELEVELDQLTGGDSATIDSQSSMDEV